jgi:hypothetical protein
MFRSLPARTRESRATSAGVRGLWVPAFAGMSGDEERFNLVGACSSDNWRSQQLLSSGAGLATELVLRRQSNRKSLSSVR